MTPSWAATRPIPRRTSSTMPFGAASPPTAREELAGFGGRLFYLGDSRGVENEKVPAASMSDQPPFGYLPFYSSNAGISPNGDGILDSFSLGLGLKRNAAAIHYTVTDLDTGEVLWEQTTEPVSKTYFSDTDNAVLYGGVFAQDALSMDWLYPIVEEDWDGDGVTDYAYYDTSRCLLEENTWVSIQAQAIGEYQSETPNANDTVAFSPVYRYHRASEPGALCVLRPESHGRAFRRRGKRRHVSCEDGA